MCAVAYHVHKAAYKQNQLTAGRLVNALTTNANIVVMLEIVIAAPASEIAADKRASTR
jgi:hypothetical protein